MDRVKGRQPDKKLDFNALFAMRSDEIHYYSIFSAINSAFPLLGMLGTILALLGMVDLARQDVTLSFTVALTSTFWGLLCALGFKAVDAMLAPSVEQNQENLKMLLERVDQYEEQKTGQTDEIAEMQDEP
jgi:flagellar motor component MotA